MLTFIGLRGVIPQKIELVTGTHSIHISWGVVVQGGAALLSES
jgi:hypothetical protein